MVYSYQWFINLNYEVENSHGLRNEAQFFFLCKKSEMRYFLSRWNAIMIHAHFEEIYIQKCPVRR